MNPSNLNPQDLGPQTAAHASTLHSPTTPAREATAAMPRTRPLYWSVRRELWENRSIYLAPLGAAALSLLGFLISLHFLPRIVRSYAALSPAHQRVMLAMPYAHVEWVITVTSLFVSFFYSLDALYGERRDRSILFWKSMPVSDLETVLSKTLVPALVLPLLTAILTLAVQWLMLPMSTATLTLSKMNGAGYWATLPLLQMQVVTVYGIAVMTLWQAPFYGWLLLVSAWSRRTPFLWAVLPPFAIAALEVLGFHTANFAKFLHMRLGGFSTLAFDVTLPDGSIVDPHYIPISQITLGRYLASPGLWLGLLFAAACLAAAVRLRHAREPI